MNAILIKERIDFYIDRTRNARYYRYNYDQAVNDAIRIFIEQRAGDKKQVQGLSYQAEQQITDELYTLVAVQNAAPTADVALYPSDYYFLTSLYATIGGSSVVVTPTTENKLGKLLQNSFLSPSDEEPRYLQGATGFSIYHGSGTISSVELNYLKRPATFTIGTESQLIGSGTTLTISSVYIATNNSVHAGITYYPGDEFTASSTTLTSGQVILASNTTTVATPAKTHEEISKMAASIMVGTSADYTKNAFIQSQANKS